MTRISEEEINQLRAHADIAEVTSHYLQLHKSGRNYKAICPFHDDHNPSLTINTDRQIYKCFVCGAGGNVFTFVQNYEKVSFPEAVKRVAALTGFHLSVEPDTIAAPKDPHRAALYQILNDTIRFTGYELDTQSALEEKEYLEKRGLTREIREHFQIGYNPGDDQLYRFLKAKGYSEADMVSTNVIRINESGAHDVFSDRITFPIHDRNGNPIGFSARTLNPNIDSKYINTNETELFVKGDIVYNSHRARVAARRNGKIYVTEGVTDVIAFYKAGIENCVCTLGTSCTESQIRLLKTLAPHVVFCYDGDEPGQAATYRAAKMARTAGCDVAVIRNETGLDPDEIVRKDGKDGLLTLLKEEISYMEFVLDYLGKQTNMNSYLGKKELVRKAEAEIATLDDEMDRKYFTNRLSEMTGIQVHYVPSTHVSSHEAPLRRLSVPNGTVKAEEMILTMMMSSPQASVKFEEDLGYLLGEEHQLLAMMIVDQVHSKGSANVNELIDEADDQSTRNLITDLASSQFFLQPYDEKVMDGAMRKVKITSLTNETNAYKEQLGKELNKQSRDLIFTKYTDCLKELRRYIDEENNEPGN